MRVYRGGFQGLDLPPLGVHALVPLQQALEDTAMIDYCRILRLSSTVVTGDITGDLCRRIRSLLEGRPGCDLIDTSNWEELPISENHASACSTLFTLLRNIESLEVINFTGFVDRFTPNIPAVCHTHFSLREVRIFGDRDGGDDLMTVYDFVSIPSVRKIYGLNIVGNAETYEENTFNNEDTCCASVGAIQDIHFERSAVEAQAFGYFLSAIGALRSFYYEQSIEHTAYYYYEPQHLVDNLFNHASRSLESLTLIEYPKHTDFPTDASRETLGSLPKFQVLKHVALDFALFIKDSHTMAWQRQTVEEDFIVEATDRRMISRLVDVLPPTLESLVLHEPRNMDELEAIFTGLAQLKEERLPKLRSIVIKGKDLLTRGIEDDCRRIGINFEVHDSRDSADRILALVKQ